MGEKTVGVIRTILGVVTAIACVGALITAIVNHNEISELIEESKR